MIRSNITEDITILEQGTYEAIVSDVSVVTDTMNGSDMLIIDFKIENYDKPIILKYKTYQSWQKTNKGKIGKKQRRKL